MKVESQSLRGYETDPSSNMGHPLAKIANLPASVVDNLASLWITDAEQLVAIASIESLRHHVVRQLEKEDLDDVIERAKSTLSQRMLLMLEGPEDYRPGTGGRKPSQDVLDRTRELPPVEARYQLPISVDLRSRMPPIRSQGRRGTCEAFAMTAVNEFYRIIQNDPQDLSEQHLYFEAKQIDGIKGECGTYLWAVAQAVAERGECRESIWPYNPNLPCNNHGRRPNGARPDGLNYRLQTQELNPNNVGGIKSALASGSVVAISMGGYDSWYESYEAYRTGRITMPIGDEEETFVHAICLIGYQDDMSAPGGGYFILRNSWGEYFGRGGPYGPGNGTIPYQYVTNYNHEARGISASGSSASVSMEPTVESQDSRTITIETHGKYNILIR